MALRIGIIGLPNVGKSTTFNALTRTQNAQVANYPFCTIEPNRAIVPVPDDRVEKLAALVKVEKAIHATMEFVDIAGLVKGASQGEGLGNQFLGHVRDTAAIVHVVRCFEDENVAHVHQELDPRADIEVVATELILADLQQLERRLERLEKQAKTDRKLQPLLNMAVSVKSHLETGKPLTSFPERTSQTFESLNKEMQFLSSKPVIYAANVDEAGLEGDDARVQAVQETAAEQGAYVVKLCAKLEEEMADLDEAERRELLELAGARESGLEQVIRKSHQALGLISFFTMNEQEVRAWTVPRGSPAPKAAGVIHTDFERGFIKAEVIPYETFLRYGSNEATRAAGDLRIEGKDYVVQDGDVIYFRFNV